MEPETIGTQSFAAIVTGAVLALFGILVFAGAYILLYRKDTDPEMKINHEEAH